MCGIEYDKNIFNNILSNVSHIINDASTQNYHNN